MNAAVLLYPEHCFTLLLHNLWPLQSILLSPFHSVPWALAWGFTCNLKKPFLMWLLKKILNQICSLPYISVGQLETTLIYDWIVSIICPHGGWKLVLWDNVTFPSISLEILTVITAASCFRDIRNSVYCLSHEVLQSQFRFLHLAVATAKISWTCCEHCGDCYAWRSYRPPKAIFLWRLFMKFPSLS